MKNIYEFRDLVKGRNNLPKEFKNRDSVLYRILDKKTNKNYIGTTKFGLPNRLYNKTFGHVTYINSGNSVKCQGMYREMSVRIDDFLLIIEEITTPDKYDILLQKESELIIKYNSVVSGYNVSMDGKSGWRPGTICITNELIDLYILESDLENYINKGFRLGSSKHYQNKGTIWVNNGKISKMIHESDYEDYMANGFSKGNLTKPNSGKVWRNNGKVSKLLNIDDLTKDEFKEFSIEGRIEPKRKPRGKYKAEKKVFVNNGNLERKIPLSELKDFLSNNTDYIKGRKKNL